MRFNLLLYALIALSVLAYEPVWALTETSYYHDGRVKKITKYLVETPASFYHYSKGFTPALGTGLKFKGKTKDHSLLFYCITDRGPNFLAPKSIDGYNVQIFPAPDFTPFIGLIEVNKSRAVLADVLPIRDAMHRKITGLIPDIKYSSKIIKNADLELKNLPYDSNSLNPRSITCCDQEGYLWITDAYGPSILKIHPKSGSIIEKYIAGKELPKIFSLRQDDKGFESITIDNNHIIYASMEGVLNINNVTKKTAKFIRILAFDPHTKTHKIYAYPYDQNVYDNIQNAKIANLDYLSNNKFLLVEQGITKNNKIRNVVYEIDLTHATDISNRKLEDGKDLEFASEQELKDLDIKMITKRLVANMQDYGWNNEKLEGITIIDDHTIAIAHDNEFAFFPTLSIPGWEINKDELATDYDQKHLVYETQKLTKQITVSKNSDQDTMLWIIEFEEPIR